MKRHLSFEQHYGNFTDKTLQEIPIKDAGVRSESEVT